MTPLFRCATSGSTQWRHSRTMSLAASPTSTSPVLSVVLIGSGSRGVEWLSVLTGPSAAALGVVLAAVCDLDPAGSEAMLHDAAPVGCLRLGDLNEALSLAPDIIVDATSPIARLAITRAALRSGAHVLCDPPMALDEETAVSLIGAAARARGRFSVAYLMRTTAGARQLRALVASGEWGRPLALRATLPLPVDGPVPSSLRAAVSEPFDTARAILGSDAQSVRCFGPPVDVRFDMADGVTFALTDGAGAAQWALDLEDGTVVCDSAARLTMWDRDLVPPATDPQPEGHLGALADFVAAIRAHRISETGPRGAAASLAMTLAALRSAAHGGRVETVVPLGLMGDASDSPSPRPPRAPAREAS